MNFNMWAIPQGIQPVSKVLFQLLKSSQLNSRYCTQTKPFFRLQDDAFKVREQLEWSWQFCPVCVEYGRAEESHKQ